MITLLIRCFGAQSQFINSKIIQSVVGKNNNKRTKEEGKMGVGLITLDPDEEDGSDINEMDESANDRAQTGQKEFSLAEVLAELDRTKRDL